MTTVTATRVQVPVRRYEHLATCTRCGIERRVNPKKIHRPTFLCLDCQLVVEPCPECLAGKCGNCDGTTCDNHKDEPTVCPCYSAGHEPEREEDN